MSAASGTRLSSTKLIVHELESTARFYCAAYGFEQTGRVQAAIKGEAIDEIFLGKPGEEGVALILMRYVDRPPPPRGEVALVFLTDDVDALVERVRSAGGGVYVEPYQSDTTPYRAAFTTDPEGHLIENVQIPA